MSIDKARRNAFDIWKEFDDRIKLAEKNVMRIESKLSEYNDKLYHSTRKYDESQKLWELWDEWLSESYREITDYAKNLGFSSNLGESYAPDFTHDKYFAKSYYNYWIEQVVGESDFYFDVGDVAGAFNRFVKFEKYCVKVGFVDELDEKGYAKIEKIIESCFDYLINEIEPKVRDYVKVMRFVEDKLENAEKSCSAYIDEKLASK